jgi:hypothetical protein
MARETKPEGACEAHPAPETNPRNRVRPTKNYLQREVWPQVPSAARGKKVTKGEREAILGIGDRGYPE